MSLLEKKNSVQKWSDDLGQLCYLLNFLTILTELTKFVSVVKFLINIFEKLFKILFKN